jgi:hypothetical protein
MAFSRGVKPPTSWVKREAWRERRRYLLTCTRGGKERGKEGEGEEAKERGGWPRHDSP